MHYRLAADQRCVNGLPAARARVRIKTSLSMTVSVTSSSTASTAAAAAATRTVLGSGCTPAGRRSGRGGR